MNDTIAAVATAKGAGGIAIIRVSGPDARNILNSAFRGKGEIVPRMLRYGHIIAADGNILDEAMAVFMPAPATYTREDVAELQCHGGDVAARRTLSRVLELGARAAEPGEFTRRAFLNGRIDLSRAEAVMQLIGAGSEAAARASVRQLEGGVSGFVKGCIEKLFAQLALIEASTDFPDEVEEETVAPKIAEALRDLRDELLKRSDPNNARLVRDGARIVLAGRPNVGKSSLMNALLAQERAIVTEIPGTTRDVLTERIRIGGIIAELSDTAGQRLTPDPIERIGVDRARRAMDSADVILLVLDTSEPLSDEDRELLASADDRTILCLNKTDLSPVLSDDLYPDLTRVSLSARHGDGVDALMHLLEERLTAHLSEDTLTVERQLRRAKEAADAIDDAVKAIDSFCPLDLISLDLKRALNSLSEITATDPTEALLDEIFSRFCVGK